MTGPEFQVTLALREAKTWLMVREIGKRTSLPERSVRRALTALPNIERARAKDVYDMPCFVRGNAYRIKKGR